MYTRFEMRASKTSASVMIRAEERHDIGVVVDAVSEVLEVSSADIEPPPSFGAKIRADFIQGMGKIGGKFVIILDIQRVLSVEEIASLATVAERGAGETATAGL